jgi:hypothetical protein
LGKKKNEKGETIVSHIARINVDILDLDCLRKAAEHLGLYFREQSTYHWYGTFVNDTPLPEGVTEDELGKCLYAIGIPGNEQAYEIGVVKKKTGKGFELRYDYWNGAEGLESVIGEGARVLKQRYSTTVAKREAIRNGFRVKEFTRSDGTIVLKATGRR